MFQLNTDTFYLLVEQSLYSYFYLPCGIFAWRDVESLLCYAVGTSLFVKMSYLTVPIFIISLLYLDSFPILSAL